MNIGIITTWFACGAGMISKSYERTLATKNKVFIYARGGHSKDDPLWNGNNVTVAPPHPSSTGIHIRHFKRWINRNSIDVIIFNEQRHWKVITSARESGVIIGAHVDYYTADTVPFFNLYDFLICNTKRHYSVFKDHPQSCYCPWGTQTDVYKPADNRPDRPLTFMISAGWGGEKAKAASWLDRRGAGMTLRVFPRVKGECRLIVLSQVPLEQCPDEWADAVNSDNRIEFRVGTFNPVPYNDGDVYVYPSRLDGIGLTLPEALSAGLAGITTNSPPMNEFVKDDENGILVDVKDYRGRPDGYYWAESICDESSLWNALQFYINEPEKMNLHAANARSLAEKELSWEVNSAFLSDWIAGLDKLSDYSDNKINGVDMNIVRWWDRHHNPTPTQRILVGVKRLITQIID